MKNATKKILLLSMLLLSIVPAKSCLVYYYFNGNHAFGATNKDWNNLNTAIRVMPSFDNKFGIVYFGYNIPEGFQNVGGINEHSLWYDGASLPNRSDIANYYNKPEYKGELCEKALETCTNVDEVIALYKQFYTPHWQGHMIWGDKYGNSVIIEFGEKDLVFLEKNQNYQLITNYYLLDSINTRWIKCRRFLTAETMLKAMTEESVDIFSSILEATHQNGFTPTLFSNIYDLTSGTVYIYNFHRYSELVKINIAELLEAGDQNISIPDLFHQIKVSEPYSKDLVSKENTKLIWYGNPGSYSIMLSKDPEFLDYVLLNEELYDSRNNQALLFSFFAPILLLLRKKRLRRTSLIVLCLAITTMFFFGSCSKIFLDPYPESEQSHNLELTNLEPDTTYYWKVICNGDSPIPSESISYSFTTNNN